MAKSNIKVKRFENSSVYPPHTWWEAGFKVTALPQRQRRTRHAPYGRVHVMAQFGGQAGWRSGPRLRRRPAPPLPSPMRLIAGPPPSPAPPGSRAGRWSDPRQSRHDPPACSEASPMTATQARHQKCHTRSAACVAPPVVRTEARASLARSQDWRTRSAWLVRVTYGVACGT
eukprot:359167-Chlamydomonas_euryale.AAC.3